MLWIAAKQKFVRILVQNGADVKLKQMIDRTVLHYAAMLGHADIVKIILEERGDILEEVNGGNMTPLYVAAFDGHYDTVRELLEHGADPNMRLEPDAAVWSPLMAASNNGFLKTVELLLKHSANTSIPGPLIRLIPQVLAGTRVRGTPLRYAAVKGHVDICRLLIKNGADPNHSNITPPLLAQVIEYPSQNRSFMDVLRLLLLEGADANAKDLSDTPVLSRAAIHLRERLKASPAQSSAKWSSIWPLFFEHGADVNLTDELGKGPLFYAVEARLAPLVRALLEKGADVNALSKNGETPVCFAATSSEEILRMLLEKGADSDLGTYEMGRTALMQAADSDEGGQQLEILLEYSPDIDRQVDSPHHFKGWTALNFAASRQRNWYRAIRLLAEHGAGFRHKEAQYGDTVLHEAAAQPSLPAILEFLPRFDINETNDSGGTALHYSRIYQDSDGNTPLTIAACNDKEDNVLCLLRNGADINLGSQSYSVALHQAARSSLLSMVKLLIEKGADVNKSVSGMPGTPLQAACLAWAKNEDDHTENTVRHLIESGAKVDGEGGLLSHPLNAAALISPPAVIDLLLEKGGLVHKGDDMGRLPIHFAAFHSIEAFERVLSAAARTPVVARILSLFSDEPIDSTVDAPDIDGWTPLCWAARGVKGWIDDSRAAWPGEQAIVMRLLLEHDANRTIAISSSCSSKVRTGGSGTKAMQKIARRRTSSAENQRGMDGSTSSPKLTIKKRQSAYCDACLCRLYGFRYTCKACLHDFDLCFKCYPHRARFHDLPGHEWDQVGPEFEEATYESDESVSSSSSSSDSSDES
ncbi:ankyrin repeat-containing domain protein [Podospora appendiculata]|uniref:Ankyrin repeat-containing domain protein n=1 Tax=Podospora appendiculata TaxID=314037 RepID=A0AAE1CEB2_9PEZI|nr:ankyrin repeat-containing domain protein [Podospora appendiculata]